MTWYHQNKRDLPWRKTRDPYRILVSEIMLQQTQVATVIPYFLRFIRTFPRVASLAQAPLQNVLKLWEGLGYYTRARNLHRAARAIHDQWNDQVPSTVEGLTALPGIGRYTSGAVASIAFDVKAPILDGNVRRVLSRVFAIQKDPRQPAVQARLWRLASDLLPEKNVGDFNQGLMELGATVCLPQRPLCSRCPLKISCGAHKSGLQNRIPVHPKGGVLPHNRMAVALIQNGRRLLIGPRPEGGLLAGLWSFPELDGSKGIQQGRTGREIEKQFGIKATLLRALEPVTHVYSHKRITYKPVLFNCEFAPSRLPDPWRWVPVDKIAEYPLPNATRNIFNQIANDFRLTKRAGRGASRMKVRDIGRAKPDRFHSDDGLRSKAALIAAERPAGYGKRRK